MRSFAFWAVTISTAAVIASVFTLPLLYSYAQALQSEVMLETDFCKTTSRDLWQSMYQLAPQHRAKRGWLFGQWVPDAGTGGGAAAAGYEGDGAPASKVQFIISQSGSS
ncbi:hypothetical protein WR25_26728 [Diploscapter pachys]|uniref:Nematode cuticle collagen N-terminal domain-containing protein n=1 Tax=Diploscapter pachys TaxID=2018661 RepID=A0A2A2JLB2_9BILA|nr:hypothetical protein WR25_26728 [Diploscapter pachys]